MTTRFSKAILAVMACGLAVGLCGCAWSIGDTKKDGPTTVHPTRGQQLIDLQKAKDAGALTPEEYEAQKKKVLEQ